MAKIEDELRGEKVRFEQAHDGVKDFLYALIDDVRNDRPSTASRQALIAAVGRLIIHATVCETLHRIRVGS